jgi:hypothetical protein
MLEDVVDGRRIWTADQVYEAAYRMIHRDIEVVLTCAPAPSRQYLDDLFRFLESVVSCGACAIEGDKEGRWKGSARGFRTLREASDYYVENMRRIADPYITGSDIRLELTTHPGHPEHTQKALTSPRVDRFIGQWYSVRNRSQKGIEWHHKYGPGRMQQLGRQRWEKIPKADGRPRLSVGLAAWSQSWAGHTTEEAMQVAYDTACQADPVEIRWWSSKHAIGAQKNRYAAKFIKSIE